MYYKKLLSLLLPLLFLAIQAQAVEKHSQDVGPSGTVYFFMKMAYPVPIESLSFISRVYNTKGLDVYSAYNEMSEQEMEAYRKNALDYTAQFNAPDSYRPDPEKLQELAATIQEFDMKEAEKGTIQKYNVRDFPSILYLTPDGYVYRYPYKAFAGAKSEKKFWNDLRKHKDEKPQKKMWENKKWSQ
ncbi:MAG: hypothetical protein ACI9TY_000253 [Alphaproteobacteria bacterium]|jgi:hypothetical protein